MPYEIANVQKENKPSFGPFLMIFLFYVYSVLESMISSVGLHLIKAN